MPADRIGAYRVTEDGGLVAEYTQEQEQTLGLTPREDVGPKWLDAHDLKADLEPHRYSRKEQQYLGVKTREQLTALMEEDPDGESGLSYLSGTTNNNNPSFDNAVKVVEG